MFRTDWEIEKELKLGKGVVNKLTSSFLISYFDRRKMETNVIDLGLNLKNWVKKVHIAEYVRYVSDAKSLAENAYDDYTHN
jgi:phosphoribosylaminoimidazole-succinocarboxamide synthase